VIVSDNGSTDGSLAMLRAEFPEVTVLENNANLGFGAANNRATRLARGEFLLLLNSDTVFKNNALRFFCDYQRANVHAPLLGGFLEDQNGRVIHSYDLRCGPWKMLFRFLYTMFPFTLTVRNALMRGRSIARCDFLEVDYITGADLFIATALFKKIGGFDEAFFMYFEDRDLCRRAREEGAHSLVISGPEIIHLEGASSRSSTKKMFWQEQSFLIFAKKWEKPAVFRRVLRMWRFLAWLRFLSPCYTLAEKKAFFSAVPEATQ